MDTSPPPPLSTPNTRTHPVQYFNEAGFSLPHGIGFGGSLTDSFRLFIPESLESCTARGRCLTYEPGRLTGMSPTTPGGADFQLASLEVWGCGDAECLLRAQEAQAAAREARAHAINKARQVDRAQFLGEFDREMLLGKTFAQANQSSGDRR